MRASSVLGPTETQSVAEVILSDGTMFMTQIDHCFRKHGAQDVQKCSTEVGIELKETPIVRFPRYEISLSRRKLISSSSLTVCCGERRSKIWTRMSLREISGLDAVSMPIESVESFIAEVQPLMDCITDTMRERYEIILAKMGLADRLVQQYSFEISGINSADDKLECALQKASEAEVCSLEEALGRIPQSFDAYLPLFQLALGRPPAVASEMVDAARAKDRYLHVLEGVKYDREYRSISLTQVSEGLSKVDCLCYDGINNVTPPTSADLATAAMLDKYARRL